MNDTDTKRCSDCHEVKPRDHFRQRRGRPEGQLQSVCHDCKRTRDREYRRGLKLALGKSTFTMAKHLRPMRHVTTMLQSALTSYRRGDLRNMMRCISKAELMLARLLSKGQHA